MAEADAGRESQLRSLLAEHRSVASGHLRLLSLDALRERLGGKWQGRADHVQFIVESVIKRHLQRGQTFYRANDSAYVIVFDFDAEDRAEFICRAISREVVQRLLGASGNQDDDLAVEMRVAVVSCGRIIDAGNAFAALEHHLSEASPQVVSAATASEAPPVTLGEPPHASDAATRAPADTARPEALASATPRQALRGLLEAAEDRLLSGGAPALAAPVASASVIDFRYLPFWNPVARAFLAFSIGARISMEGGALVETDSLTKRSDDADLIRTVDRLTLCQALLELRASLAAGRKYIVVAPVHRASLAREADMAPLLALLEQQPDPIPRLVAIEIIDARSMRWSDLARHCWSLRGKCRQTVLRQTLTQIPWLKSQHLPDGAVGMSVALARSGPSEAQTGRDMASFMAAISKHRIETFIHNVRSRSLAFAAIGAGFDHVSGPAIAPRTRIPKGVAAAGMDEIFAAVQPGHFARRAD